MGFLLYKVVINEAFDYLHNIEFVAGIQRGQDVAKADEQDTQDSKA